MPYTKIFYKKSCNFFDDLVSYLATLTSLGISLHGYDHGYTRPYKKDEVIALYGNKNVIDLELRFSPYQMMEKLAKGSWPEELMFAVLKRPINTTLDSGHEVANETIHSKVGGVLGFQIQAGFIRYFESYRSNIEAKHGNDVWSWPDIWLFAWAVRNAFAHGGHIYITNSKKPPITWKSLSYTASDNGKNILHQDIGIVEVIYLMEEMDKELRSYT